MSSTYGQHIKLSLFGQSHGAAIGMTLDGVPAGLPVDEAALAAFMRRRAPGFAEYASARKENDTVEFLSGIINGYTCGAPIAAIIKNENANASAYENLQDFPRPGHADYTARQKYQGFEDACGGGHFSGRLTAPLCIAGALCIQWLAARSIAIRAHILSIGDICEEAFDSIASQLSLVREDFPVFSEKTAKKMQEYIRKIRECGDSVGGIIECAVTGLPAGIGEPMFGGMESQISQIVFGIPAVKGIGFGAGFSVGTLRGSENNDPYTVRDGKIVPASNRAGGILGGITTGLPLIFQVAVKPTPSISLPQQSVSYETMTETTVRINGRHDACIAPRAVPAVEAAAAIAVYDAMLQNG